MSETLPKVLNPLRISYNYYVLLIFLNINVFLSVEIYT